MNGPKSLAEIDFAALTQRKYTPSPDSWNDQVLYFLMLDRFSDGNESGGHRDNLGHPVNTGSTRIATSKDAGSVDYDKWVSQGRGWQGGNLKGLKSKLGYLRRMGVTAIWVSPIFKQAPFEPTYHGYAIQNFLEIDPHFGTREELRELVDAAHQQGIYVILDVILNHSGNVFDYSEVRYQSKNSAGVWVPDARWDGRPYKVAGFRDAQGKPTIPFDPPDAEKLKAAWPDGAIWPQELQSPDNFMRLGRITNWDYHPEFNDADFLDLKKLNLTVDWSGKWVQFSNTLRHLVMCYYYWIAYADVDGFRIDTVKHMGKEPTRFFCSIIHELAAALGKERFLLAGEVTGGRRQAWSMVDSTGLDSALGIEDIPQKLERMVTGECEPKEYFDLFRNSQLDNHGNFAWFGQHVITMFDDHDKVCKGSEKCRFAGVPELRNLLFNALAVNLTTAGIPCIYYGSEQAFDSGSRRTGDDVVLRENMFGGRFGGLRSQGAHFFNEDTKLYGALAKLNELRDGAITLRRGRQFLHDISGDGIHFGLPTKFGSRLRTLVAWSRNLGDHEMLVVFNTDEANAQEVFSTLTPNLRKEHDQLQLVFSYTPENGAENPSSAQFAAPTLNVEKHGDVLCVKLKLGPAGFAIYSAGKYFHRARSTEMKMK